MNEFYLIFIPIGFGILAYLAGFLDVIGSLASMFFGVLVVVASGLGYFLMLLSFMVIGSLFTLYKRDYKKRVKVAEPEHGREINPVIANGTIPAFFAILGNPFMLTGALSAALADTLGTEIGVLYRGPWTINTGRKVKPGTRGAVSWLGEAAALGGSSIIALAAAAFLGAEFSSILPMALVAGLASCNLDSLLGATMRFLSEHEINVIATLAGAGIGGAFLLV